MRSPATGLDDCDSDSGLTYSPDSVAQEFSPYLPASDRWLLALCIEVKHCPFDIQGPGLRVTCF